MRFLIEQKSIKFFLICILLLGLLVSSACSHITGKNGGIVKSDIKDILYKGILYPAKQIDNPRVKLLTHWSKNSFENTARNLEEIYGIKVEIVNEEYSLIGERALLYGESGQALDLVLFTEDQYPVRFAQDIYLPLDSYLDFNNTYWAPSKKDCDLFRYNGKIFVSVNRQISRFIFFNHKIYREHGLTTPYERYIKGQWSWESLMEDVQYFADLKKVNPKSPLGILGSNLPRALQASKNAAFVVMTPEGLRNASKDPNLSEAIETMQLILSEQNMIFDSDEENEELFKSGECAMMYEGIWRLNSLYLQMTQAGNLGFVPLPFWEDQEDYYAHYDYSGFMISKNVENMQGALAFLDYYRVSDYHFLDEKRQISRMQDLGIDAKFLDLYLEENKKSYKAPMQHSMVFEDIYDNWTPFVWILYEGQRWKLIKNRVYNYFDTEISYFNEKYQ